MGVSYVEPLSRAIDRARLILFQPFELAKWLVMGFAAWLAGLASGGFGGVGTFDRDQIEDPGRAFHELGDSVDRLAGQLMVVPLVLLIVTLLLALALAVLWLSSRAKLVFLDNVVNNRAAIVEPWQRLRRLGNSLFLWRLGFAVVCLVGFGLVVLAVLLPAATLSVGDALQALSFAAIFLAVLTVAVMAVIAAFVALLLENFVIPIMYRFDMTTTEAWRAFLPWLRARGGWFVVYGLFVLLLALPLMVAFAVVVCCTCCVASLPYVGTVILLPLWVTYRAFGPEFLAQFDPSFELFAAPIAVPEPLEPPETPEPPPPAE